MSKAVIAFGRLNPISIGHQKLVDAMKKIAKDEKGKAMLFLSHSYDSKKNPLPYDKKYKFARKAFGPIVQKSRARTIIEVLRELSGKYDDVVVVAGGDRIKEFETLLNRYNGKDYQFDSIEVKNAGDRDPDADDVSGMSASKMRAAVAAGEFEKFKKALPPKLRSDAQAVFDAVKEGMNINEAVLNMQQRRARKMLMRRIKGKIKRGRAIARRRMANPKKLKGRAQKHARQLIRKKVAGARGAKYKDLPMSARIQIDKQVEKRKALIQRIAKRMLPKVRKAERERLAKARKTKKESINYSDILNVVNLVHEESIAYRVEQNLRKKAEKYGVTFDELKEAYLAYKSYHRMDERKTFQSINTILAELKHENES